MVRFRENVNWDRTQSLLRMGWGDPKQKNTATDVMLDSGALFEVKYPPARYWDSQATESSDDYPIPFDGEGMDAKPLFKFVVREDTKEILGLHSGKYPELPNYGYLAETAEMLFPNSTTSCTVFGKGERVALTQDIQEPFDLGGGDVVRPQLLWMSSFNGQWSTTVYDLMGRLFCMNQLVGRAPMFRVKHTKNHDLMLQTRREIVIDHMKRSETFKRMAEVLRDQEYTNEQFIELTKDLVPNPPPPIDEATGEPLPLDERSLAPVIAKRKAMKERWVKEVEKFGTPEVGGTAWLAYNAIQGAEQHDMGRGEATNERSLLRAIEGKTLLADRALDLLHRI